MNQNQENDVRGGLPSASAAERWMLCPASNGREQSEKVDQDGEASTPEATFGTRIHAALEGKLPPSELETAELETFEKIKPLWYGLMDELGFGSDIEVFHVEHRLWMHDNDLAPMLSGQLDMVVMAKYKPQLAIIDYKTLKAPAPAAINWQLRCQAVLLAENFPEYLDSDFIWNLCLIQPNATPQLSVAKFQSKDVSVWAFNIEQAIRSGQNPEARAFPGHWCNYCKAKKSCREHNAFAAIALADTMLPDLAKLDVDKFKADAVERWSQLSPFAKVGKLAILKLAADLYADLKKAAEAELMKDKDAFQGFAKLAPGRNVRNITDAVTALIKLGDAGIHADQLVSAGAFDLSIGKAEVVYANVRQKASGEKITKGCPEKYQKEFHALLADLIETNQQKPTLALNLQGI